MKKTIKLILLSLFYRVRFDDPYKWGLRQGVQQFKWDYTLVPRRKTIAVVTFLIAPVLLLLGAVLGALDAVRSFYRALDRDQSSSEKQFVLPVGQHPSKKAAYLKTEYL